jgi:hypothetical protein
VKNRGNPGLVSGLGAFLEKFLFSSTVKILTKNRVEA